ncbi:MAG: hypothetical protein NC398_06450 [Acetatifactor muris]|nr:hypothetical protein [Acetatifactor muris]MCM1526611.1 hypothetical protein [Bacteroides sp.]
MRTDEECGLFEDAHDWAMTLNKRILNSSKHFEKYMEVIAGLGEEDKEKILNLLSDVKQDNPDRFGEKVDLLYEKIAHPGMRTNKK